MLLKQLLQNRQRLLSSRRREPESLRNLVHHSDETLTSGPKVTNEVNLVKTESLLEVKTESLLEVKTPILSTSNSILLDYSQDENLFPVGCIPKPTKRKLVLNSRSENQNISAKSQAQKPSRKPIKSNCEIRRNDVNIEMLPSSIYQHIFGNDEGPEVSPELVSRAKKHLSQHELLDKIADAMPDIKISLPELQGKNIEEHFYNIANEQCAPYRTLLSTLTTATLPDLPTVWSKQAGWTKYEKGKEACTVPFPLEDALVFDIEECMQHSHGPTLATAVSPTAWYSWVSSSLAAVLAGEEGSEKGTERRHFTPRDFINLESGPSQMSPPDNQTSAPPKVVVGHNVSFDRARVKEQYWLQESATRFIDTLSLHVAVSGVTSYQRAQLASGKSTEQDYKLEMDVESGEVWRDKCSLNNLNEVHKLYCGGKDLDKSSRDVFVSGTLLQVAERFDELVSYCASDVIATHEVLAKLFPLFLNRFKHPATLSGILELSVAYLPVNQSWTNYIRDATETHDDLEAEAKFLLAKQANEACRLLHEDNYKSDPWLWDQDWSVQDLKLKKSTTKKEREESIVEDWDEEDQTDPFAEKFRYLVQQKSYLPKRRFHLPGYPAWYRKLCPRLDLDAEEESETEWQPGPELISPSMHITPKLLRLTWDGYPLHKVQNQGWGLLIPGRPESIEDLSAGPPLDSLKKMCPQLPPEKSTTEISIDELADKMEKSVSKKDFFAAKRRIEDTTTEPAWYQGSGVWCPDVKIPGCWFRRLPHPEGAQKKVGNPLARDFVTRLSEGTLRGEGAASTVLEIGNAVSYWRNNRVRVESQQVVWLETESLPRKVRRIISQEGLDSVELGAIIPQLQVCGTLTRRAVERTWLTASNADPKRVGSELRAMIRAPPGYHLVGADVDSQELWLAALLGDAAFAGLHGATAFGWRTLEGRKSDGTDLHSATAKAAGTSRHHAKVMNYARIYGAGTHFAQQLLKRFSPGMTDEETKKAANNTMTLTKGRRLYLLPDSSIQTLINLDICTFEPSSNNDQQQSKAFIGPWGRFGILGEEGEVYLTQRELQALRRYEASCGMDLKKSSSSAAKLLWYGGTESAMFNSLEQIASNEQPCTPFLQARLSRALEPCAVGIDNYLPTRVNWVVQSSAVDFLHLMLVSMRWLLGDSMNWRFVLSFHDEVRYLVPSEKRYEAALALHVTNLLSRAFCARRLGIHDLPRSVAFFSAVEVDLAMRKDANSECITPSNPHGLSRGYGIPPGETLDVYDALEKAGPRVLLGKSGKKKTSKLVGREKLLGSFL